MTRTFIALDLDDSVRRILAGVIHQAAQELPAVRWVDPQGIHLTLAFLGELTDERLAQAMQATEMAAQQAVPFEIGLSHLGVFDSPQRPRVIWMGLHEPLEALQQLYRTLNRELEQRGFAVEKRPFSPHLTLARVKAPLSAADRQGLLRLLTDTDITPSSPTFRAGRVCVMKSELFRSGARYTHLGDYPLGLKASPG